MLARERTPVGLRSNQTSRNDKSVRSLKVVLYGEPAPESPFQMGFSLSRRSVDGPKTGAGSGSAVLFLGRFHGCHVKTRSRGQEESRMLAID